jgi:hypothetical protein
MNVINYADFIFDIIHEYEETIQLLPLYGISNPP